VNLSSRESGPRKRRLFAPRKSYEHASHFFDSLAHVKDRLKQGDGVESGLGHCRQIAQILGKHSVSVGCK
jgi:hypothetical protein